MSSNELGRADTHGPTVWCDARALGVERQVVIGDVLPTPDSRHPREFPTNRRNLRVYACLQRRRHRQWRSRGS